MKRIFRHLMLLGGFSLLSLAIPAFAQSGGAFDLSWNTIDGGGAIDSAGGSFSLSGTIGQHDAGTLTGGTFTLEGGFWNGVMNPSTTTVQANVTVKLFGYVGNIDPITTIPVQVIVDGGAPTTVNFTSGAGDTGNLSITVPATGSHTIRLKPKGYLAQQKSVSTSGYDVATTFRGPDNASGLLAGDVDDNNTVDDFDLFYLTQDFLTANGSASGFDTTDNTGDNFVDDFDLFNLTVAFLESGD